MKNIPRYCVLLLCLLLPHTIQAQDTTKSEVQLQEYISGEKIDLADISPYIVVVHFWCSSEQPIGSVRLGRPTTTLAARSLADVVILKTFYKKYRRRGILVVGAHATYPNIKVDRQMIWDFVTQNKVPYPVVARVGSTRKIDALPYTFVFDVGNQFVYGGENLRDGLKAAEKLVDNYGKRILGDTPIQYFAREAQQIVATKNLSSVYRRLQQQQESKSNDEDKRAEAGYLLTRLQLHLQQLKREFAIFKKIDPAHYLVAAKQYVKLCEKHPEGQAMKKELASLKKDKNFAKLLTAQKYYEKALLAYYNLRPNRRGNIVELDDDRVRKRNSRALAQIQAYCKGVVDKFPGNFFARQAQSLLDAVKEK